MEVIKLGKYRHFKGKEYEVIGIARHSETEEEMVVYRALYEDHGLWVRPASMWNETVMVDGQPVKRFTFIDKDTEKRKLYEDQKALLDQFLEKGAISQAQYDKSFGDLTEKMGMGEK